MICCRHMRSACRGETVASSECASDSPEQQRQQRWQGVDRRAVVMAVARLLYRSLLRRARAHDRRPALKALLANQGGRPRVYDRRAEQWTEVENESDATRQELSRHSRCLFGGREEGEGVWYMPGRRCDELVRDAFREELDVAQGSAQTEVDVFFAWIYSYATTICWITVHLRGA